MLRLIGAPCLEELPWVVKERKELEAKKKEEIAKQKRAEEVAKAKKKFVILI
jgi:hypothetical protein